MERRTNRPEGSGGASPTAVTSRAGNDDLDGDTGQETRSADIVAPKRTSRSAAVKSASTTTAPANGNGSEATARGALATSDAPASQATGEPAEVDEPAAIEATGTSAEDGGLAAASENGHGARLDDTFADGVPAFPADTLMPSRSRKLKDPDRNGAGDQFLDSSSPAFSFGEPETSPVSLGTDDWSIGSSDETHREPSSADSSPTVSNDASSSAEPSAVSPAAFAWEMPDPPPDSRSSPARSFLRAGASAKSPSTSTSAAAVGGAAAGATAGATKTARSEGMSASLGMPRKVPSKRSARQAHLTVARVEPWSVMKFSFVVSLVAFVILFVAVSVLYGALSSLGVFESLQKVVTNLTSSQSSAGVNAAKWWSASRILGYTALLGSLNIVLITAMSTIGAVVYNLTSRLVGGVEVTLRETE